jgi:hypothetical protein
MRKITLFSIGFLFLLLLAACANSTSTPTESSAYPEPEIKESAYPAPIIPTQAQTYPYPEIESDVSPAYPGPETLATSTKAPTPTQDVNLGAIRGRLLTDNKPVVNVKLYLADVLKDEAGVERATSYDPTFSEWTTTDSDGNFYFVNIQPAKYGLVLDIVIASYLLPETDSENPLLITVEGSKTTEVGDLDYTGLPLPGSSQ